jgi:hypothetical protein
MQPYGDTEYYNLPRPNRPTDPQYEPRWRGRAVDLDALMAQSSQLKTDVHNYCQTQQQQYQQQPNYQRPPMKHRDGGDPVSTQTSYATPTPSSFAQAPERYEPRYDWSMMNTTPITNQALGAMMKQSVGIDITPEEMYQGLEALTTYPWKSLKASLDAERAKKAQGLVPPRYAQIMLAIEDNLDPRVKFHLTKTVKRIKKGKQISDTDMREFELFVDQVMNMPQTRGFMGNLWNGIKRIFTGHKPAAKTAAKPAVEEKPKPPITHENHIWDIKAIITRLWYWLCHPTDTAYVCNGADIAALAYAEGRGQLATLIAGDGKLNTTIN